MVKIAIAGATGEVALEITDGLVATQKHEIVLLSRKDVSTLPPQPGTQWVQVNYDDKTDPGNKAQRNLIDASIAAGVKRFAPSEWATSSFEYMDWYAGKAGIRNYLETVNKGKKVLEYTLFQPGLFLNYFTHPHKSARHVNTFQTAFDFQNRRAIVPDGYENVRITLTAVQDLVNVVVKAIEYESEWPVISGIKGCELTLADLIQLGEEVRGGPFTIDKLMINDLKAGIVKSTWLPKVDHPAIPPEQADTLAGMFLAGMTLGMSVGALNVTDEWNQLLPDYEFIQPFEFLSETWQGKF